MLDKIKELARKHDLLAEQLADPAVYGDPEKLKKLLDKVGGAGTLRGPILGAILMVTFPEVFRSLQTYRFVFYGAILIVMMLVRPAGLLGWESTLPYKLPKGTQERKQAILKETERKEQAVSAE